MTNVERLAEHMKKTGPEGILIHTMPNTPFWLVCTKIMNKGWTITLCHPLQERSYLVGKEISDESHLWLFNELVKIELGNRITRARKKLRHAYQHLTANAAFLPKIQPVIMNFPFKQTKRATRIMKKEFLRLYPLP